MGYLLRLSERNSYDTPLWILQMALPGYKQSSLNRTFFDTNEVLNTFAQITGVGVSELAKITYCKAANARSSLLHTFFGHLVPGYLIRPDRPKICPSCLLEHPYCKRVWELSVITACPVHRRLLIDECPRCNKRIPWSRKYVSVCACKFDWRESPVLQVKESDLGLTRHIHQLCGLTVDKTVPARFPNAILDLPLNDFLRALFFIAGQRRGISSATSKHFAQARRNKDFHTTLITAYSVFENWPRNYFQFLEQRAARERGVARAYQRMKSALYRDFGSFYSGLHGVLPGRQFDFMRSAFIEYITTRSRNDLLGFTRYKSIEDTLKGRYVLKSDVRRLLGVDNVWINYHIETERITTVVRSKGKKRLIFIKVEDVARLRAERDRLGAHS